MRKLILAPLAFLVLPQCVVWSFWFLLRLLGLDSTECRVMMAVFAALVLLVFGGLATGNLLENWIPAYDKRRRELNEERASERERIRREIDEQIGIPRVPRARP